MSQIIKILCFNNLFIIKSKIIFETILKQFKISIINKENEQNNKNVKEEVKDEYVNGTVVTFLDKFE